MYMFRCRPRSRLRPTLNGAAFKFPESYHCVPLCTESSLIVHPLNKQITNSATNSLKETFLSWALKSKSKHVFNFTLPTLSSRIDLVYNNNYIYNSVQNCSPSRRVPHNSTQKPEIKPLYEYISLLHKFFGTKSPIQIVATARTSFTPNSNYQSHSHANISVNSGNYSNHDIKALNYEFRRGWGEGVDSEYKVAGLFVFIAGFETLSNNEISTPSGLGNLHIDLLDPCGSRRFSGRSRARLSNPKSAINFLGINSVVLTSCLPRRKYSTQNEFPGHNSRNGNHNHNHSYYNKKGTNSIVRYTVKPKVTNKQDFFRYKEAKRKKELPNTAKIEAKATKSIRLAESNSRLKRLLVHIQFILRGGSSGRPWTLDDFFALGSWLIMSNALWILVGTTTFVSVVLFILNHLNFQPAVSSIVSNWISRAIGISVNIESAIIPKWRNGRITLKNVNVECGPQHALLKQVEDNAIKKQVPDTNFAYYKMRVDEVDIELSLVRWIDGKGIVKSCFIKGVRGVIDQRHVWYDYSIPYVAADARALHRPGYFDFDFVEVEDIMFNILYPNFRPVPVAIHYGTVGKLRQQWFFYDVMNSTSIVGMYDNSLFSIRKLRQLPSVILDPPSASIESGLRIGPNFDLNMSSPNTLDSPNQYSVSESNPSSSLSPTSPPDPDKGLPYTNLGELYTATQVKIDNLDISHLNYGVGGPIGWITSGRVDIDSTLLFPSQSYINASDLIEKLLTDLSASIDVVVLPSRTDLMYPEQSESLIVKFLSKAGLFDTKPVNKVKEMIMENYNAEMERRLKLQSKRTLLWRSEYGFDTKAETQTQAQTQTQTQTQASTEPTSLLELGPINTADIKDSANPPHASNLLGAFQYSTHVLVDLNVEFNNVRASVPMTTPHLSYLNSALLIRPIVGYMNSHRVNIPIKCKLKLGVGDFDGSWNAYDSGVVDLVSEGMGRAFAQLIKDENERNRRLKMIGIWSVSAIAKQFVLFLEHLAGIKGFLQNPVYV